MTLFLLEQRSPVQISFINVNVSTIQGTIVWYGLMLFKTFGKNGFPSGTIAERFTGQTDVAFTTVITLL